MQATGPRERPVAAAFRPAEGGVGVPLRLPRRPVRLPLAPPRAERADRFPGEAGPPRAPDRDPAEDGLPGRRGLHPVRRPRRLRGHRLVRDPPGRPAPRRAGGVGPELYLRAVDGWDHYASMARMLRADNAEPQLLIAWGEKGDGRPRYHGAPDRTDLKAGRFRIARVGRRSITSSPRRTATPSARSRAASSGPRTSANVRLMARSTARGRPSTSCGRTSRSGPRRCPASPMASRRSRSGRRGGSCWRAWRA